jgi:hypothetical protein
MPPLRYPKVVPTQAAASFRGLPDHLGGNQGFHFAREYEVQENLPLDGSKGTGRLYSPFVIRVVLPNILGGDQSTVMETHANPQRTPPGATVRSDNRDVPTYSQAQRDVRVDPSGETAYNRLVDTGRSLPGLTRASARALEDAYNQAIFQQQFGTQVQNATRPPTSQRTNTVTPAVTNDTSALSVAIQIKRLMEIPPLVMLINPTSMKTDYTKVAQNQNRSRKGYLYEAWGEEMVKLSFTFRIGAYVTGLANTTQRGRVVSGVQRASRNDSASFQQLMTMLALFQSGTYIQDTEGNSRAFQMVGNLAVEYDQMVYVGHMENFSFGEEEAKQHGGLEITIDFVANKVFDLANPVLAVQPMKSPQNASRESQGSLLRRGTGNSLSFLSIPTIGGTSSLAQTTNQAWDRAVPPSLQTGATSGVDLDEGVLTSRRR